MKSFKVVSLTILFVVSLLKNSVPDITKYLQNHYGYPGLKVYRKFLNESRKLEKCKLDLLFLTKCKTYDIIPKFLRFKLYRKSLHAQQFYKSWRIKLLDHEISDKKLRISSLTSSVHTSSSTVQSNFSTLDNFLIVRFVSKTVENEMRAMERTHLKKLQRLGIYNQLQPCDPDKIVHNYSDVKRAYNLFLLSV